MIRSALPEVPIFQNLTRDQIEELSTWLRRQEYAPNQEVFPEGSPPDGLYVVARGEVTVLRSTTGGPCEITHLEGPCVFGEMALVNDQPHSAGVRAVTRVITGFLPREVFDEKLAEHSVTANRIVLHLCQVLCQRLRDTTSRLLRLSELCLRPEPTAEGQARVTRELHRLCQQVLEGTQK